MHAALLVLVQLLRHPGDFMRREGSYRRETYERHVAAVLRHTVLRIESATAILSIFVAYPAVVSPNADGADMNVVVGKGCNLETPLPHLTHTLPTPVSQFELWTMGTSVGDQPAHGPATAQMGLGQGHSK